MKYIKITTNKKEEMSELVEKMLRYGGKLMHCLESLDDEGDYGERMGRRDDEEEWDEDDDMGMRGGNYGMRRGRNSRGRYSRY